MRSFNKLLILIPIMLLGIAINGCTVDPPLEARKVVEVEIIGEEYGEVFVLDRKVDCGEKVLCQPGVTIAAQAIPLGCAEFVGWRIAGVDEILSDKELALAIEDDKHIIAEFFLDPTIKVFVEAEDYLAQDEAEEQIHIDEIRVDFWQNGQLVHTEEKITDKVFPSDYVVNVCTVDPGEYELEIELIGAIREEKDLKTLYKGEKEGVLVEEDADNKAEVTTYPLPAEELEVKMESPDGALENLEKVILKHAEFAHKEYFADYIGDPKEGSVIFKDEEMDFEFIPSRWHVLLEFESGRQDAVELLLLPTEEKEVTLLVEVGVDGSIRIIVIVSGSPSSPYNLRFEDKYLKWDWDGEGDAKYTILKSETNDPDADYLEPVTPYAILEKEYDIEKIDEGYYYWVRAYVGGYSSALSEPVFYGRK